MTCVRVSRFAIKRFKSETSEMFYLIQTLLSFQLKSSEIVKINHYLPTNLFWEKSSYYIRKQFYLTYFYDWSVHKNILRLLQKCFHILIYNHQRIFLALKFHYASWFLSELKVTMLLFFVNNIHTISGIFITLLHHVCFLLISIIIIYKP